ncbi:hypothetical protein BKA70DRAFT_1251433 [Coprinopsis sp. MPI-PUGE-AT-0042]|nr:hypothetical protein BKA70DRAFT_1251433 [Coprinopsis sp. MPI-PUGE-AT-0042]
MSKPDPGMGDGEDFMLTTRRIRHISTIQVRNLTPFPARDAFTSALSHTNDTTQPSSFAADDIEVLTSRKRIRTLSNVSGGPKSAVKWEGAPPDKERHSPTNTIRGRRASGSKVSFTDSSTSAASTVRGVPGGRFTRPRTTSKASTSSIRTLGSGSFHLPGPSSFLPDNTQSGLERVIDSRLLETCIVVTVVEPPPQDVATPMFPYPRTPTLSTYKGKSPTVPRPVDSRRDQSTPPQSPQLLSGVSTMTKHSRNVASESSGSLASSNTARKEVTGPSSRPHVLSPSISRARSKQASLSVQPDKPPIEPTTSRYISPVHRPSTNPDFAVGPTLMSQFSELGRSNASSFHISLWGKMPAQSLTEPAIDDPPYPDQHGMRWKMLDEWDVNMSQLVPVPESTMQHAKFTSNTLLFQLAPLGRIYRLPARQSSTTQPEPPNLDYSSDPEFTARPRSPLKSRDTPSRAKPEGRRRAAALADGTGIAKTASWPDIFQLATDYAHIADNTASLNDIILKYDRIVQADIVLPMRRDISERQDRIADLQVGRQGVLARCAEKRLELQERRAAIERRRELLSLAREVDQDLGGLQKELADVCLSERSKHGDLRANLSSMRASLISALADIFPIELYSPPDLLFTILDLPLPIPLLPSDPAPPLSLPDHPHVNEDTIAAALGFVAEVLQLLSAYLGTSLTYPVTCVGSRSLIRDGISSMVGPRTFPLYAKGVDTYRFEYGLMAEKDLRALDVRHTLPNLKNLLLILSHDSSGMSELRKRKPPETPSSTILELDPGEDLRSENVDVASTDPVESHTPPRSGATTPTPVPSEASRSKSRSFLGLAPFAGFLRDGDDEDKRTIHGVTRDESGLGTMGVAHGTDASLAETSRTPGSLTVS